MIGLPKFDSSKLLVSPSMKEAMRHVRSGRVKDALFALMGDARTEEFLRPDGRLSPQTIKVHSTEFLRDLQERVRNGTSFTGEMNGEANSSVARGARFEPHTYAGADGSRTYKLYIPAKPSDGPQPLIVMLHGCTQSPDDFAAGTRMNEIAEEFGFLVAYPAQPSSANPHKCWNWFKGADQRLDAGEPALIAGITRSVIEKFAADASRIYIAGLSAGGAAAAIMAAEYPDLYTAVGIYSGLACGVAKDLPSELAAMKSGRAASSMGRELRIPTIVFHGDRDATVNPKNSEGIIAQATPPGELDIRVETASTPSGASYTRKRQTNGRGKSVTEQWIIHGAAHAWSGGSAAGSFTDSRGPDASREMVRFFLEHS